MLIFQNRWKAKKISTRIKMIILVYGRECLIRSPGWNDHSKTTFMTVHRLPENSLNFRKFENFRIWSILMIGASAVWKFFLLQTSMLLQNAAKGWNSLGHLQWTLWAAAPGIYYSNVYGKISFAPLIILASVVWSI